MKKILLAGLALSLLSSPCFAAQETILGGSGVLWGDEKVKVNSNFTQIWGWLWTTWTPTGTIDLSSATVTFGLETTDIPDLSASYEPAGAAAAVIAAAVTESDTTHCPDGASVFTALAGKQVSGSYLTSESDPVFDAIFDAYTMLYADTDNTPAALSITANTIPGRLAAGIVAIPVDASGDCAAGSSCFGGHEHTSYASLASPAITGDPTITDATTSLTLQDSDNAAGTASTNANSSGGANDMTWTWGVEDSTGESTGYFRLNGVTERVEPLKPMSLGPIIITGTDDALIDEGYAGTVITGVAGATLAVGDIVYLSDADGRWELADNDSTTAEANQAKGVCVLTAAADGDATNILIHGKMRLDSWTWNDNEGQPLYLSATAGDLTETRTISASSAPQVVAYIESDDEIFVNPQPVDFSRTRIKTDADGQTLTCLEVQNTMWEVTAAATIVGPALSACPTQNFTICSSVAGAVVYDPNAADDTIVDGVAKADGVAWTSGSALGDCITITQYDTDTLFGVSNGWTAP
jgi:hypothetical protein